MYEYFKSEHNTAEEESLVLARKCLSCLSVVFLVHKFVHTRILQVILFNWRHHSFVERLYLFEASGCCDLVIPVFSVSAKSVEKVSLHLG